MADPALLSVDEMRAVEAAAFARGVKSSALMERAGNAVAEEAAARYPQREFLVLTGPGNNGGDGFIVAVALIKNGRKAKVAAMVSVNDLRGDAAWAAAKYKGGVVPLTQANLGGNPVIIDALFGIGLTRAIKGDAAQIIREINKRKMDVIAVDIPSGVHGDTGEVMGAAPKCTVTVTFAHKKYGHVLMPGRAYCGEVVVTNIGIAAESKVHENHPHLWRALLPWPQPQGHKYQRGHTLVIAGPPKRAGAARLAGLAALRAGSGLVSLVCDKKDLRVYASKALSLMTETRDEWKKLLADERKNTVIIGPGAGVGKTTRDMTLTALKSGKRSVLDADALTSFASHAKTLFAAIKSPCILTPHDGEFARLFPKLTGSKLEKALQAAALSHAVVVLKGYDTVIAAPDGRAAINTNAPPDLATAGSGDVLSGICAGLLSQGMAAFDAACAGVWIHGQAATLHGAGLIAEDLVGRIPAVLQGLKKGEW
jgi:NAD(P)H-hydrate epimerase